MILKQLNFPEKATILVVMAFCLVFLSTSIFFPEAVREGLSTWTSVLLEKVGFFYLIFGLIAVLILLFLAFSKWGEIKLGSSQAKYGWFSWIAMLYSTGMGAGLLLRAVQEPTFYFQNPPRASPLSQEAFALEYTFFHWGLTPWAFYGLFGLMMAFLTYTKKESALSSSILPKKYQSSAISVLMNVLTIICTLFGVVAALGLGGMQLLEAIGFLTEKSTTPLQSTFLIVLITILATASAFLGLSKGIKSLSILNISMATLLLLLASFFGLKLGTRFEFFSAISQYLVDFLPMSLNLGAFKANPEFLKDWTYFYWAFWLAWSPFTGVFIARISQGRSIREFILGVLIVPALGTFLWFTVFGQSAFHLLDSGLAEYGDFASIYTGIFAFFGFFPLAHLTKLIALMLVFTFLITSVDSAIYVLSMFSDAGKHSPSKKLRLIWGFLIGTFTISLIIIGKNELLESISQILILFTFPFSMMFFVMFIYFLSLLFWKKSKDG